MSAQAFNLVTPTPAEPRANSEQAARIVDAFLARNIGHLLTAGTPRRVLFPYHSAWVVPVEPSYPGYGPVGVVGNVIVDEGTGEVIAWTSPEEMCRATEELYRAQEKEITAGLARLRKAENS